MGTEFQHRVAGDACREVASNIDHYIQEALLEPLRLEGEQRAYEKGAQALGAIMQKAKKDNADGKISDEAWAAMVPYLRACTGKLMVLAQDVQVAKNRCEGRIQGLQNAKKIAEGHADTHATEEANAKNSDGGRFGRNSNEGRFGRGETEIVQAEFDLSEAPEEPEASLEEETNTETPPQLIEVPTQEEVEIVEEADETVDAELEALMESNSIGSLRKLAKEKGIKVSGKKRELAQRILAAG